ncbi:phosphoglycerate kinase [Alphaproteobacteria bacterium]|nr:phosphoglycerate kinase [Alphaproteobacteria bacterium]
MATRTIDQLIENGIEGRLILLRADLNVPLDENMNVGDKTRLERVLPTLRELSAAGARIAILSHFGRPKGNIVPEMSLAPVAKALGQLLGSDVALTSDCIGEAAEAACKALKPGDILVLENTRFHPGEETNDREFAEQLAKLGDVYINDAFSAAHRAHASTEALAHILPSYVGRAMQAELDALNVALENPQRPVVAVIGGAKISTKLDLLGNLSMRADCLVIGGGMANTFLAAQGYEIGKSLCEDAMLDTARDIIKTAAENGCEILLPNDVAIAPAFAADQNAEFTSINDVPADQMILDCGPNSIDRIKAAFENAKTLLWNGPLGAFEIPPFDAGTNAAALFAAQQTEAGQLVSVAGGGDTVAALNNSGAADKFTYISTAGGAFLEWLEGKALPGVEALDNK